MAEAFSSAVRQANTVGGKESIRSALLLNKTENLNEDNIDDRERYVKFYLDYYHKWKESTITRKVVGDKGRWQKQFLAKETWINLRIAIRGFFGYARQILPLIQSHFSSNSNVQNLAFVPVLHSNTSSIEGWFSIQRGNNCSTALTYASGVAVADASQALLYLQNNKAYDPEYVAFEKTDRVPLSKVFQSAENYRSERLLTWIAAIQCSKEEAGDIEVSKFGKLFEGTAVANGADIFKKIEISTSMNINSHYNIFVATDSDFQQWCRLTILGTSENQWFTALATLSMEENRQFDSCCQVIMENIFLFSVEFLNQSSAACSCFEMQIYNYSISNEFRNLRCNTLPTKLQPHQQLCCSVLLITLAKMHQQWLVNAIATASKLSVTSISLPIDELSEVNRFVGWAVASLLQKWKSRTSMENCTPASCIVDCILCMRVLHAEAVQDETYSTQYYSQDIKVRNQGGLALIAHEFFDWALKLLSTIRVSFTEEAIRRIGNDCMKVAYDTVTNIMENEKISFHKTMRKCLELNISKKIEEATIEMVRIKVIKKSFMQGLMWCLHVIPQIMSEDMPTKTPVWHCAKS